MKGRKLTPLLVIVAGLLAYQNGFTGPFIFDDVLSITENPSIQHLWPIWQCLTARHSGGLTVEGRPLINLSLAINYAIDGYKVWGYHAFNLIVHILAGLTLLGIVRRTLLRPAPMRSGPALRDRFGAMASELAAAVAVLWTVHPLQTESVTYVIQRAESIMGLFYLLTLYCFIRGAESPPAGDEKWFMGNSSWTRLWYGLSVAACALGMASKEVMVTAPVMVLLYDRTFVSGSFREAWRRRWPLYFGLAATWVLLGFVLVYGQLPATERTAEQLGLSWWQYFLTEPGVILHYLRLSVWPHPLCFDYYGWPVPATWTAILVPAVVMAIVLGATVSMLKTNSGWGFVGAWFFLILAPTSSVVPLDSPAYEHRMYLPLAAVVVVVVFAIQALAPTPKPGWMGRRTVAVLAALVIVMGFLTWRRNRDYRSDLAIWTDTVARRPDNSRAHNYLGAALWQAGKIREAISQYGQALELKPDYPDAQYNLGNALFAFGKVQEAAGHWEQAVRIDPGYVDARNNLGAFLAQTGHLEGAAEQFEAVLRITPDDPDVHYNLARTLEQLGRVPEAIAHYEQALRLKPDYPEVRTRLARLQVGRGNGP